MVEYREQYEITGPKGKTRGTAFVDTGATFTVIPKPVAEDLGLEAYRPETVDTNNGPVEWEVAKAEISVGGKPAREQDVFIAPGQNPLAIGAESLGLAGFQLKAMSARSRLNICEGCDARIVSAYLGDAFDRCADCGCLIAAKARLPGSHCPRNLW